VRVLSAVLRAKLAGYLNSAVSAVSALIVITLSNVNDASSDSDADRAAPIVHLQLAEKISAAIAR
jgi:hypothetical protein